MLWLRWLVTSVSLQRPKFIPRPVHTAHVDKMAVGQFYSKHSAFPYQYQSINAPCSCSHVSQIYLVLATECHYIKFFKKYILPPIFIHLRGWVTIYQPLKMKAVCSLKTWGCDHPTMQHHIPNKLNPSLHSCQPYNMGWTTSSFIITRRKMC